MRRQHGVVDNPTCSAISAIGIVAVGALPHAAHDLGDLVTDQMPGFARAALLSSLLLLPILLGEGHRESCA